ncbi:hypothetical protein Ae201684_016636 [Aphanomyces euteiches]|uniref:Uncharacterized protein n=1 Tax=Aphanomyces euteiches TaxID=100861 RepID=A0A6G0WBX9_9STRA|nr:hypothetical protein Ae201684_016636 [Aphanomyces euteiches]
MPRVVGAAVACCAAWLFFRLFHWLARLFGPVLAALCRLCCCAVGLVGWLVLCLALFCCALLLKLFLHCHGFFALFFRGVNLSEKRHVTPCGGSSNKSLRIISRACNQLALENDKETPPSRPKPCSFKPTDDIASSNMENPRTRRKLIANSLEILEKLPKTYHPQPGAKKG